ncbi:MAG: hypothetical protein LBG77_02680 [Dysgonamonadaceae bacterium]|nr:hypothetical protein [Dysgonamonadaceae bacterium]
MKKLQVNILTEIKRPFQQAFSGDRETKNPSAETPDFTADPILPQRFRSRNNEALHDETSMQNFRQGHESK